MHACPTVPRVAETPTQTPTAPPAIAPAAAVEEPPWSRPRRSTRVLPSSTRPSSGRTGPATSRQRSTTSPPSTSTSASAMRSGSSTPLPLYKYEISGRDAERFLGGLLARDIRTCRPGRAQYTIWCDDDGYVLEDGVVFRHSANDFLLTAAEPNLSFLQNQIGSLEVSRRGRLRPVRDARRPGPTVARGDRCPRAGGQRARLLRPRPGQDRRQRGDDQPHRVHRRPRLRGSYPRRRRAAGTRRGHGGRRAAPHAPVRRPGPQHRYESRPGCR